MKGLISIALAAGLLGIVPDTIGSIGQRSNSEASTQRGREAFAEGRYEDAAREFGVAAEIKPDSAATFNLGTSRIAAGDVAGGLQSLTSALEDGELATDVRYNAGWAALQVEDFDNAILAYEQVLRDRPGDGNAKRNLEIALQKKKQQQQQQQQPQPDGEPDPNETQQPPDENGQDGNQPSPPADPPRGPSDVDSILRSVEQQEKEELERMRRSRGGRKVDW